MTFLIKENVGVVNAWPGVIIPQRVCTFKHIVLS